MAAHRKYPWEKWFSEPRTELVRGVDYHCSQSMMWQTVRSRAWEKGVKVKVTDTHEGLLIEVLSAVPLTTTPAVAAQPADALA